MMMPLKNSLLVTICAGALTLTACNNATNQSPQSAQDTTQDTTQDTAQNPMPGMDHGNMPSMNHGSMSMSMDLGPKDETFDLRFIDGMIPHHEGAVVMAEEALEKSQRPEIKQLAQAIIDAQAKEIAELQTWRKTWYPDQSDTPVMYDAGMGHTMPMSAEMRSSMMMSGELGAADAEFDLRFINAMIPHHQGAIEMAKQAQEKSDRPEIKELAQNIITSQQQEITQMEQWRNQWYNQ